MRNYTHLSLRDRSLIANLSSMKISARTIAQKLGCHHSTIYRELKRNKKDDGSYHPSMAHQMAKERHQHLPNRLDKHKALRRYVMEGLKKSWSPEQIVGRMKEENQKFSICVESIYRYIYNSKKKNLYKLLPKKRKRRLHRRESFAARKNKLITERNIAYRPTEASLRDQVGHWEGDTIRFNVKQKTCVTTLVERKSRLTILLKNEDKMSRTIINNICHKIIPFSKQSRNTVIFNTLTLDQGTEFRAFLQIEHYTPCKVYFCDTHSPWQRPTNENTNGRIRRFLSRKTKIDRINQEYLNRIADIMNDTPRKCLGYKTPKELFIQQVSDSCRASP